MRDLSFRPIRPMPPRQHRPAFTLVEMLVVIGLIAGLIAVIAIVATKARGTANKFQLAAQIQMIDVALEAYKTEFQAYPTTSADDTTISADDEANRDGYRGARTLCKALMGSSGGQSGAIGAVGSSYALDRGDQDGKVGLGFSTPGRSGVATLADTAGNMVGKTFGPFLAPEKFKVSNIAATALTADGKSYVRDDLMSNLSNDMAVLLDGNGSPILYYPCLNPQAPPNLALAYVSQGRIDTTETGVAETISASPVFSGVPMYRSTDNGAFISAPAFRRFLGDKSAAGTGTYGVLDGTEKPVVRGKYLLWMAGPDGIFGINASSKEAAKTDDVTNFDFE